jgi:hypothetical protein
VRQGEVGSVIVVVSGFSPRLWYSVANTSPNGTGRSFAFPPVRSVLPMTCPVRIPPPARIAQLTCGQWSRPDPLLIVGVRPNSPHAITVTSSSIPRTSRSSTRAVRHWSSFAPWSRTRSKFFPWLSHRP